MVYYTDILFDLDGTLSDSKLGITKSCQYALRQFGIEATLKELERFVGPPLYETFSEVYGFGAEKANEAVKAFREYFAEKGIYENEPYDGIEDLLKHLNTLGFRLHVATSKPTVFAEKVLEKDNLKRYFKLVVGSELDGSRSDKAEVIDCVLKNENINGKKAIMVGDRKHDLEGARKNGVDAIAVLYGYGDLDELEAYSPVAIAKTVEDLKALLTCCVER